MQNTNLQLWNRIAVGEQPRWEKRSQIIGHFIRPKDIVLDLGAGNRQLKTFIPASCDYIPVDCTDRLPGTFLVDFNEEFRLPDRPFTVIVSAGFLEYIVDLPRFMGELSERCPGVFFLFTYSYYRPEAKPSRYRKLNHLRDAESVAEFFSPYCDNLREIVRLTNSALWGCDLAPRPAQKPQLSATINQALRVPPKWRRGLDRIILGKQT